jgi:exoribonuclease R
LVVCDALAAAQIEGVYARLTTAGIEAANVDLVVDTGALHICCRDEMQARMVMALNEMSVGGGVLRLTRGDGALLPLDQLPDRFVQPVGKIVAVTPKDPNRSFCGTLRPFNKQSALFVSKDRRVPRVVVPHSSCPPGFADAPKQFGSVLVSAKITDWPTNSTYAKGEVDAVVGEAGDVRAEIKAILLENDVDDSDFPAGVLDSLPKLDAAGEWHIPADELARRRDLRDTCIFTIDPATARDLDDALSFRALDDGGCEVHAPPTCSLPNTQFFWCTPLPRIWKGPLPSTSIFASLHRLARFGSPYPTFVLRRWPLFRSECTLQTSRTS